MSFSKSEIALVEAARAISAFWKTHSCKLIPNWTRNRMITYTNNWWRIQIFKKNLSCLNRHLLPVKSNIIPLAANLHRLSLFSQQMKSKKCRSVPTIPVLEKAAETIWRLVKKNAQIVFNFLNFLVIFSHYLSGDGKVSSLLTARSDTKVVLWLSYVTECDFLAGNQFWKFSCHCSIFVSDSQLWALKALPSSQLKVNQTSPTPYPHPIEK